MSTETTQKLVCCPCGNRVLVKFCKKQDSVKGIYLPDSAKEKCETATVVAVGPGKTLPDGSLQPILLKLQDMVILGKYANQQQLPAHISDDPESYALVSADDIAGVIVRET